MSACKRIEAQLPEFVAGDLPAPAMAGLRQHLRDCHGCRQQASLHLRAQRALRAGVSLPGGSLPEIDAAFFADFHGAVMQRVDQLAQPSAAPGRWRRFLGAAAALALFGLGVWFVQAQHSVGMLGREMPAVQPALPVPMPWAGGPAVRELGSFSYGDASRDEATVPFAPGELFTQGMMGRAMLPHFVEVEMLGLSTLTLDTRVPKPKADPQPRPPTGSRRPR